MCISCPQKIYANREVMFLIMAGGNYLNLRTSLNFSIYGMDVLSLHFSSLNKILSFLHISTCSIRHKFIFFKNSNHVTCHVDYILKYERQLKYIFKHNDNLNFLNSRSVFLCSAVILCTCQCKESPEGANKISIFCIVVFFVVVVSSSFQHLATYSFMQ